MILKFTTPTLTKSLTGLEPTYKATDRLNCGMDGVVVYHSPLTALVQVRAPARLDHNYVS